MENKPPPRPVDACQLVSSRSPAIAAGSTPPRTWRVAVSSEFEGRWLERALGREVADELARFGLAVRYEVTACGAE